MSEQEARRRAGIKDYTCGLCGEEFGSNCDPGDIQCTDCDARLCPCCGAWFSESAVSAPEPPQQPDDEYRLTGAGRAVADAAAGPPERYALIEQMGHRATVGAVRETTFAGKQMLAVTDLKTGGEHLISPESLYEVTWLTEEQARGRATPWTAQALPAGDGWPYDDDEAEGGQ